MRTTDIVKTYKEAVETSGSRLFRLRRPGLSWKRMRKKNEDVG